MSTNKAHDGQMLRFYLSNVRLTWPFARQEAVIAARFPDWLSGAVYRDDLPVRKRKAHSPDDLSQRAMMLRVTSRRRGSTVYVPSLAVLALTPDDLAGDVLPGLAARGDTLASIEDGTTVPPDASPDQIATALAAFRSAMRRVGDYGKPGGMVSGERRAAATKAACETVRERWGMPSDLWTIKDLDAESGVCRPSLLRYLGPRTDAQRAYELAKALAERNRSRRKTP